MSKLIFILTSSDITTHSATTETTALDHKLSTKRKNIAVRSTRTPNTMFPGESRPNNPSASIASSTGTRPENMGGDKPLNRVQTAPTRSTGHPSAAETTPPRRQKTTDFSLSLKQSHSSDFLNPLHTHSRSTLQLQMENQRESVASTEPSSYYSADDSFHASLIDEEVPPLPNPHPLSISTESRQTLSSAQTSSTRASKQTVMPTQDFSLGYRTSTRTNASTSTGTTGRSSSLSASVIEPSRQSTSDSEVYTRGNTTQSQGLASKNKISEGGAEDDLATLVAGLEELVEEPEFDNEEPKWDAKGKMKMPEPQYFATRLSTTQEEEEEFDGDDEGDETMRKSELFTHSLSQISSTSTVQHPQSFSTRTTVRKISPLIIPPTPKSPPPPVPSSVKRDQKASISTTTEQGKSSSPIEPQASHNEDGTQVASHPLRAGSSNANTGGSISGTAPLKIQRHSKRSSSPTRGGEERIPSTTGDDNATQQHYGTATITGSASSRIERSERPGSSGGGGGFAAPARTSIATGSTNIFKNTSGRVKTDNTSHRPSTDGHTYGHGRTISTTSTSGVGKPSETRMSGGLPLLPNQEKPTVSESASAAVAASTIPNGSRLPPDVSSQMGTQYVNMLLALDDIPSIHNWAASFFNWIYLAGFVLFPGTFTSLKNLGANQGNAVAAQVIHSITQLPL